MKCNEEDTSKRSSSSCNDEIINKENVAIDKPNAPNLNLEPHQMKRKKYNLRKSLAWDRAFFTEEGVLDPSELSTLSRNVGRPAFHEERELKSSCLDSINELQDLEALEDDLFKELPPNVPNEGSMAAAFSPKPASLARNEAGPASAAKRKVLSASNISQSASKRSGCLRPVASSSLPRPASTKKTKVTTKDSKVFKLLALKPDTSDVSMRSMTPKSSRLKRNQITHPAGNGQKNIRLKATSTNTRSVRKDMKLGPDKSLTKSNAHNAISKVSPVPKIHSSTKAQRPQVNQVNNSSVVIPDLVHPAAAHPLNGCDGSTSKIAVSLSQNASCNSVNTQYTQFQTAKPSGLRMPSPSLGFFSQSKPTGSLRLVERTEAGKLRECNIPSLHKADLSNCQCPSQPSKKTSAFSSMRHAASAVSPTSHGKIKCNSESNNKEKMVRAIHNSKTYDELHNQQQLHEIHDNPLLLQGGPGEQLKKSEFIEKVNEFCLKGRDTTADGLDVPHSIFNVSLVAEIDGLSEKNSLTANYYIEDRQHFPVIKDNSDCSDFLSLGMNNNSEEGIKKVDGQLCRMQEVYSQTAKPTELMKFDTCEVYTVSNAESLSLCLNNSTSIEERSADELNNSSSLNSGNAILKSQDCSAGELEVPYSPSCCNDILYTNNESSRIGNLYRELHVGDEQLQSIDDNLLVERCEKSMQNTMAVDNQPWMIVDDPSEETAERTELPFPCLVTEQALDDDCRSKYDGYLLHGKRFSSEESTEKNLIQSGKDMVLNVNTCRGELESFSVLSSKSPAKQDSSSNAAGMSECLHVENPLVASVDSGVVKVASGINDMSGSEGFVDKCRSSMKNFIVSSSSQPGKDANARGSSILENSCFTCMRDVNEDVGKTEVMTSFCESDQNNESQREFDDILNTESRSLEDRWKFSNSNIANAGGTIASEVGSLNDIHQCEKMEQTNELPQVNRTIKETVMQNAQMISLDDSLLSDIHNSNISPLVANKTSTVLVHDIREKPEEHSAVRNPYLMIGQAPLEKHELFSDDNLVLMDNTSAELRKGDAHQNVLAVGLEQDGLYESRCFDVGSQIPPVIKGAGSHVDKKAEHSFMVDTEPDFIEIPPSVGNRKCSMDGKNRSDDELIDQATSLEFNSSSDKSRHQILSPADNCDSRSFCSLNEKSKLLVKTKEKSSERIPQGAEVDKPDSSIFQEEAQINVPETSGDLGKELQHGLDVMHPTGDKDPTLSLQKPVSKKKQDACGIKPPPNLLPFSDEWLAALEAAGEEILTMKGGAVQNSPPDKFEHEPGPWSPVRRKNAQGIGPFDCTKFTNNIPPSTSD